jgi:hypothetical protein
MARIMKANDIPRRLARKVAWAVAMSTAAYGAEAMWEGQSWLLKGFDQLTTAIARAVTGTFSTAKGTHAIRAADAPQKDSALWPLKIGSMAIGSTAIRNLRNLGHPSRAMAQLKEAILPVLNEE